MDIFNGPFPFTEENQTVTSQNFYSFLTHFQKDSGFGKDQKTISNFICDFVQDPQREIQDPYLTISEVSPSRSLQFTHHTFLIAFTALQSVSRLFLCFMYDKNRVGLIERVKNIVAKEF